MGESTLVHTTKALRMRGFLKDTEKEPRRIALRRGMVSIFNNITYKYRE